MNSNVTRVVDEVITALSPGLRGQPGDRHTRYASTTVPGGDVSDVVDVLVQTAESRDMFALWHGDGLPTSCDEEGFAAPATCALAPDGSIVAWLEEVRTGEDDEPYELVRVLVAFRSDGLVVTLNRYADAGPESPTEPWAFETLQELALSPAWRTAVAQS